MKDPVLEAQKIVNEHVDKLCVNLKPVIQSISTIRLCDAEFMMFEFRFVKAEEND